MITAEYLIHRCGVQVLFQPRNAPALTRLKRDNLSADVGSRTAQMTLERQMARKWQAVLYFEVYLAFALNEGEILAAYTEWMGSVSFHQTASECGVRRCNAR